MSVTFYAINGNDLVETAEADDLAINLSNMNAGRVLGELGFYDEYMCGAESAEDFLGAVLLATALVPEDEGVPATQVGNVIDCGRAPGYLQERFGQLSTLAQYCLLHGYRVAWA